MKKKLVELDEDTYNLYKHEGVIDKIIKEHNPELQEIKLTFKYRIRRTGRYFRDY